MKRPVDPAWKTRRMIDERLVKMGSYYPRMKVYYNIEYASRILHRLKWEFEWNLLYR